MTALSDSASEFSDGPIATTTLTALAEVPAEVAVVARAVSAQPQEEAAEMVICGLALAPVVAAAAVGGEVLVVGVQSLACTPSGGNGTRRCSYNSRSHSTTILVFCCSRSAA